MPLKLIAIGVALLALAGLLWHDHAQTAKANRLARETNQLRADYAALEAAHAHERKIAKEASDGYQEDLKRLELERGVAPVIRVCKPASSAVPASSSAPIGSDATSPSNDIEAAETDIGPALIEYGIQCEANMLQLDRLRQWVNLR